MAKTNFPAVAKRLRTAVKAKLVEDLKSLDGDEDVSMTRMYKGDAKDGNRVADLIEKGKVAKALEKMSDMDTSACEEVGTMLAKTSPAFYVEFLEPDGWVEVWHLNDNLAPPADDPTPKAKAKAKKTAASTDMAMVVSVEDGNVLNDIAWAVQGYRKRVKAHKVGFGTHSECWGVIYTGRLKERHFAELCAEAGFTAYSED